MSNDGDGSQATVVTGPERGTLNLNANGGFSYASTGAEGMDGYIYQAKDAANNSHTAVALISVLPPGAFFKDDFERPADLDVLMPWRMREGNASISGGLMKSLLRRSSMPISTPIGPTIRLEAKLDYPARATGRVIG